MKQQVSPAVIGVVVVVALALIIFLFMKGTGTPGGSRPTAEQLNSGPSIGGKHFPTAAPIGGGGGSAPGGANKGGE